MASMPPNSDALQDFVYEPLQPDQIRILQLAPGHKGDTLVGELLVSSFNDNAIEYDALSYMWGDPAPADRIYLSGKTLPIASNLTTALHHLRYVDKPLIIWIDAICIDQQNNDERAKQVPLMRHLYKRASIVRIWINEPGVDSKCDAVVALQDFPVDLANADERVKRMGNEPTFLDPLVPIFTNKYWMRAWVQQEVLNATELTLHCMDIVVNGGALAQFQMARDKRWVAAWRSRSSSLHEQTWSNHLRPLMQTKSPAAGKIFDYQNGRYRYDLCQLLFTERLYISQPQDRLYALMHLAKDYVDGSIEVDYTKTSLEVMMDAAAYHVRSHHDLRFLYRTCLVAKNNTNDEEYEHLPRPTWLPQSWLGHENMLHMYTTRLQRTSTLPSCTISTTNRRLRMRGLRVDHLKSCFIDLASIETPRQFWNSMMGSYLLDSAGTGMENLPDEAFRILFGKAEHDMSDFAEGILCLDATSGSISEFYFWGEDKDIDARMLVLMKRAAISALDKLWQFSQDARYADQSLYLGGSEVPNPLFVNEVDTITTIALLQLYRSTPFDLVIMSRHNRLGCIPDCDFKSGDEIWIVLGLDEPLVLRPQSNGYYWHVCTAAMPSIQEHDDFLNLSSDIQPGDKIGEWVVEDIEIE